jgi:hypothetical protein
MQALRIAVVLSLAASLTPDAREIDYAALWAKATPFHTFLDGVHARQEQWRSRFANAAIDAAALAQARALPGKRHLLVVAEDRCSDSAWAVPNLAKLAAVVPEKLELRVIGRAEGGRIQSANLTPDGRLATPTVVVLDDKGAFVGAWVERPAELQKWYIESKPTVTSEELHRHMDEWYTTDAGRSTVNEVLAILNQSPGR